MCASFRSAEIRVAILSRVRVRYHRNHPSGGKNVIIAAVIARTIEIN